MFQPVYRFFKKIVIGNSISAWNSKGLCDESIKPSATSDNSFPPSLPYFGVRPRVKFDCLCLKQDKVTFTHENVVNIYINYEINSWACTLGADFMLGNALFAALRSTKNTTDFGKYKYSGYCIGLHTRKFFVI